MEFIERLGLLAMVTVGCFFFVFMFWRLALSRKTRGAMSRGRIVWLLLKLATATARAHPARQDVRHAARPGLGLETAR